MADFTKEWTHSDIVFVLEEKRVYANKAILAMWSPVLAAMFNNDFKERGEAEINLPGKSFVDFLELMRVVHPPIQTINGMNVFEVLPLSHEYQMREIINRCEIYLLSQPPSVKNLVLAETYGLETLLKVCVSFAKHTPMKALKSDSDYVDIELSTLVEILEYKLDKWDPHIKSSKSGKGNQKPTGRENCRQLSDEETDFTKEWTYSDVTFVLEEKRVYANKAILSMWSPVLAAMFNDSKERGEAEINLPGKSFEDFLELMKVVHPPIKEVDGTMNIFQVLPLSYEYQMTAIINRCEKYLLSEPPSVKNLVLADTYGLGTLLKVCVKFAKKTPIKALKSDADYVYIEPSTLVDILDHKLGELDPLLKTCVKFVKKAPTKAVKLDADYRNVEPSTLVGALDHKLNQMDRLLKSCIDFCQLTTASGSNVINTEPSRFVDIVVLKLNELDRLLKVCVKFAKKTPGNIELSTLVDTLNHKLNELDRLILDIKLVAEFSKPNPKKPCYSGYSSHSLGNGKSCGACRQYNLEEILRLCSSPK